MYSRLYTESVDSLNGNNIFLLLGQFFYYIMTLYFPIVK